jgi:hypothetical protein
MVGRISLGLVVLGLASSALAVEAATQVRLESGQREFKRFMSVARVVVAELKFDLGALEKTPIRRSSAGRRARGQQRLDRPGGRYRRRCSDGMATSSRPDPAEPRGLLEQGVRDTYTIEFPYVYRRFDQAKSILVTLES